MEPLSHLSEARAPRPSASGITVGAEFRVDNSTFRSGQEYIPSFMRTLAVDGGGFLVVWISYGPANELSELPREVRSQLFDSAGERLGHESLCTSDITDTIDSMGGSYSFTAAALGTYGFVFAWHVIVWTDDGDWQHYDPVSGVYATEMCRTAGGQVGEILDAETDFARQPSIAVLSSTPFPTPNSCHLPYPPLRPPTAQAHRARFAPQLPYSIRDSK
eukprot:2990382-Rhodomonas_salina.1